MNKALKTAVVCHDKTQWLLAAEIGIAPCVLSTIINKDLRPTEEIQENIADALGIVDVTEIFPLTDEELADIGNE